MHLQELKARVERADYPIDPYAVAEAMLRRADLMIPKSLQPARITGRAGSPPATARRPRRSA